MALIAAIPFASFKPVKHHDTLYCFLKYEKLAKNNKTWQLVVSDALNYDDWKENSIEIRKKFVATSIDQTGVEVWDAGIKEDGLSSNKDYVETARAKLLKRFVEYHTDQYGNNAKTYTIALGL